MASRTKNTSRNIVFATLTYVVRILLTFVTRTLFIRIIGVEFLGLNSLFTNILVVLSLAELGIGNAIVYSMYKPVADGDTDKIKSLVGLYKRLYFAVGIVVIIAGIAVLPFLDTFIAGTPPEGVNIRAVFLVFLAWTVVGYFFAFRRSLIFAHQRGDIESKIQLAAFVVLNSAQIILILTTRNYYLYVIMLPIAALLDAVTILVVSYRLYPHIRGKTNKLSREEKRIIAKNVSALFLHRMSGIVVVGVGTIIVSYFLGLTTLGLYSNYMLIITTITTMLSFVATALTSSIGNLIASEDIERVMLVFRRLTFFIFVFVGFCAISLIVLFQPFVRVWLGEEYLLSFAVVLMICISFYITACRRIVIAFKECAGIFRQDIMRPIIECAVMIPLAIVLVIHFGLIGLPIAMAVSSVLAPMWIEPWVVYRCLFKRSSIEYFRNYFLYTLVTAAIGVIVFTVVSFIPYGNIWLFAAKVAVSVSLTGGLLLLVYFKSPHFGYFWSLTIGRLRRRGAAKDSETVDPEPTEQKVVVENTNFD